MRRRPLLVVALALAAHACGGAASPSNPANPSPTLTVAGAYLNTMISTMAGNSVNRLQINWPDFSSRVRAAAPNAQTIAETAPAIRVALGLLGDGHSFFEWANGTMIFNPGSPSCSVAAVSVASVPSDIGYLRARTLFGPTAPDPTAYADALQASIRDQDRAGLAGWIVDLRNNGGGNMWPMIAGLGPVLGTGTAGFFVPPVGAVKPWGYGGDGSYMSGFLQQRASQPYVVSRASTRVAVLTDKGTASSGEAVVVAFRARPDTRFFGTETCGVPTANSPFRFSDGSTLWMTTSVDADRTSQTYNKPISPDETIADPAAVLQGAIAWLRGG